MPTTSQVLRSVLGFFNQESLIRFGHTAAFIRRRVNAVTTLLTTTTSRVYWPAQVVNVRGMHYFHLFWSRSVEVTILIKSFVKETGYI